MKAETEPITEDEWLIRLVDAVRFTNGGPPVSPNAFEPRVKGTHPDVDGLSLFRKDCLAAPEHVLLIIAADKRPQKGLVLIPFRALAGLGLTVIPKPISEIPGHVVIPELNSADYAANKARFTPIKVRLAELASDNIFRNPAAPGAN